MQISNDDKGGSSEDIFTDQELFGPNNCVIAKLERYEGKNEAMSFRMKKSNHRTTDAWRKSILDGSYKLDFDQDFQGKSLVSTYLVIYEDNKLEKNEKCCIVLDANAPLGTIHILLKHFYSTKLDLISQIFTKTGFFFRQIKSISFSTLHFDKIFMP